MFKVDLLNIERSNQTNSKKIKAKNDDIENKKSILENTNKKLNKTKKHKSNLKSNILEYLGILLLVSAVCFFIIYMVLRSIGYDFNYFR